MIIAGSNLIAYLHFPVGQECPPSFRAKHRMALAFSSAGCKPPTP